MNSKNKVYKYLTLKKNNKAVPKEKPIPKTKALKNTLVPSPSIDLSIRSVGVGLILFAEFGIWSAKEIQLFDMIQPNESSRPSNLRLL